MDPDARNAAEYGSDEGRVSQDVATATEQRLVERWHEASRERDGARSVADVIQNTLVSAIVEHDLPWESRLREDWLANLFGVSRTPVREALAGLVNARLAVRDQRGSLRVASVTPEQILDAYAVRKCLEGLSAGLAAASPSSAALGHLRQLQRACRRAVDDDFTALAAANSDFHLGIAESTGNHVLISFIADIERWTKRFPTTTLSYPGRRESALEEHDQILDAIENRDTARAERLAREHMSIAERIRMEMLFADPEPAAPLDRR